MLVTTHRSRHRLCLQRNAIRTGGSSVQNAIFSNEGGSIDWPATCNKATRYSLACEIYEKSAGICPPVDRAIPRDFCSEENTRGRRIFWPAFSVRRKNAGPRVDDILSRKQGGRAPPGRYGFRHIIRDFFPVPGEIGGICRRVFGGTSERISVNLDRVVSLAITYVTDESAANLPYFLQCL